MNYLVTLYCAETDEYAFHTIYASEGDASTIADNLATLRGHADEFYEWDVHDVNPISDVPSI